MPVFDAILILGGGVREGGALPPWAIRRYDLAMELQQGEPLVCLSAATAHRPPPLDDRGFPFFESAAGASYMMTRGIPAGQIRLESVSYDTIGNAYFSKLLHVDPAGWRRLLVITSDFHMPRSQAIFEWVYGIDEQRSYDLRFQPAPDDGLDNRILTARRNKEAAALNALEATKGKLTTSAALHEWIFTEHRVYSAQRALLKDRASDEDVLASY